MSKSELISDWFHTYSHDVYDFLVYYTGKLDVEDLVQEVFIKAIKGLKNYQKRASPKTWLISIARNVAIDEARKKKRSKLILSNTLEKYEVSSEETPEQVLFENEEIKQFYELINSMQPNYRDVLLLRAFKDFSIAETASILNWSEGKVSVTYHRALKALKKKAEVNHNE